MVDLVSFLVFFVVILVVLFSKIDYLKNVYNFFVVESLFIFFVFY